MPRKSKKQRSKKAEDLEEVIVTKRPLVAVSKPTTEVVTEQKVITTEPEIEIRKPSTLAQALTEPALAVVKPKTRVRKTAKSRRVA